MTNRKFNTLTNELTINQALMVGLGVDENEIFRKVLEKSPDEFEDDESYFKNVLDGLIALCEQYEHYEVCESLKIVKDNIRC